MNKITKIALSITYDLLMIIFAYYFSFMLRFDFNFSFITISDFYISFLLIALVNIIVFFVGGLYKSIWHCSSLPDLLKIIQVVTIGVITSSIVLFMWTRLIGFPRSVLVIYWLLLIILMGGGRFGCRFFREWMFKRKYKFERENLIIVGAGASGEQICREIIKNPSLKLRVVAFIDDDPKMRNRTLLGIPIVGDVNELPAIASKRKVKKVYIAIASATGKQLRRIVDTCVKMDVEFKTLPKLSNTLSQDIKFSLLRKIKPEDLLGRETVSLDFDSIETMIKDKVILVSGAGGSIGSELCRQLCKYKPKMLVLYEITELFIFELENELNQFFPELNIKAVVGDVRDMDKVGSVFSTYKPELVFHAAAYKHVPMMESNPLEAIKTNVWGTKIVGEASKKYGVKKFILISTDKAVNPTSIMGTTKRIAEMVCTNLQQTSDNTKYITVRFGNVLGSSGSVIPVFKKQIQSGGPVTVTHPDVTRFFMSIPEATQLVMQAGEIGHGGEIFVLDMGTPVRIVDLAKDMINLAGFELNSDISINYTGLRPGEKLFEELFSNNELQTHTTHPKVYVAEVRNNENNFDDLLNNLKLLNNDMNSNIIKSKLKELVQEYCFT